MEDTTLQGTLTSPLAAKKKNRLRQYTIDLMQKYRDPKFAKYALYATNEFDPAAIEQELEYYNQFVSGQDTSTNKVNIGGRTHEIKTLADEKALQDMNLKVVDQNKILEKKKNQALKTVSKIKELEKHPGLNNAVGVGKEEWYDPRNLVTRKGQMFSSSKNAFIGKAQNVLDQATTAKLIEVKGEGATFGALEKEEREMIQRSASPIWQWIVTDSDGKIVGYNIDEKTFKEELERLKETAQKSADENSIQTGTAGTLAGEQPATQGSTQTTTPSASGFKSEDDKALEWANANPNDPRSKQILEILAKKRGTMNTGASRSNLITAPDGQQIEIID